MATETELRGLITAGREGVLGTINRDGLPQLSNVLYLPGPGGNTARISTTADRLKAPDLTTATPLSGRSSWDPPPRSVAYFERHRLV
jgi:pyridoxamine 5'-phosphate oxidase-like protein